MKIIYHTSHCGSTLLTALLSTTNRETYSEPSLFFNMVLEKKYNLEFEAENENQCIVKLPSSICHTAAKNNAKKVFLYQNLGEHLVKVFNCPSLRDIYLERNFQYVSNVTHPEIKNLSLDSDLKKHIFLWANNILWLRDSSNVLWVKSSDLFNEMEKVTLDVCFFLQIPPVVNYSISTIHVKHAGLNYVEVPVSEVSIPPEKKMVVGHKYGIIPSFVYEEDEELMEGCDWLLQRVPSLGPYVFSP